MELIYDYKHNNSLRQSFDQLAKKVFGISFEEWYQRGFWQNNYICYSYRDGDQIVSNVSVTKMRAKVDGEEKKILQIGTVMTAQDYRGLGLAGKLMEYVINEYQDEYEVFCLFANKNVLKFYPKFGFKKVKRSQLFTTEEVDSEPIFQFRKLNLNNAVDAKLLVQIAEDRVPISEKFFIKDSQEILYWYCLSFFKNNIFYNEAEEMIVIYGFQGNTLNIYDVISKKPVSYQKILKSICKDGVKETVFHFHIDADELKIQRREFDDVGEDDSMFIRGQLNMADKSYPMTAHT